MAEKLATGNIEKCIRFAVAMMAEVDHAKINTDAAFGELAALVRAAEQTRWIPCAERMPEVNGQRVIQLFSDGHACSGAWIDSDIVKAAWKNLVVAWMPLPLPPAGAGGGE